MEASPDRPSTALSGGLAAQPLGRHARRGAGRRSAGGVSQRAFRGLVLAANAGGGCARDRGTMPGTAGVAVDAGRGLCGSVRACAGVVGDELSCRPPHLDLGKGGRVARLHHRLRRVRGNDQSSGDGRVPAEPEAPVVRGRWVPCAVEGSSVGRMAELFQRPFELLPFRVDLPAIFVAGFGGHGTGLVRGRGGAALRDYTAGSAGGIAAFSR